MSGLGLLSALLLMSVSCSVALTVCDCVHAHQVLGLGNRYTDSMHNRNMLVCKRPSNQKEW